MSSFISKKEGEWNKVVSVALTEEQKAVLSKLDSEETREEKLALIEAITAQSLVAPSKDELKALKAKYTEVKAAIENPDNKEFVLSQCNIFMGKDDLIAGSIAYTLDGFFKIESIVE